MKLTILKIEPENAQSLAKLSRQTFFDTFDRTCTDEDMRSFLEHYYNLPQIQKELSNPDDHFYFAMINNQPVGYMRFMEEYDSFPEIKNWKALELNRLYFLKEYHGQGLAQQMMLFLEEYAIENSYEVIWLGVWEHNIKAQKFYMKNGFVNSGFSHDFPIGNTPQTDLWFWKFLGPGK